MTSTTRRGFLGILAGIFALPKVWGKKPGNLKTEVRKVTPEEARAIIRSWGDNVVGHYHRFNDPGPCGNDCRY